MVSCFLLQRLSCLTKEELVLRIVADYNASFSHEIEHRTFLNLRMVLSRTCFERVMGFMNYCGGGDEDQLEHGMKELARPYPLVLFS